MADHNPELFTPVRLGAIEAPNRVFMAPLTRSRASEAGVPSDMAPEYYRQRADAGLIIAEATQISQQGQGYAYTPGIYTESHVEGWKRVTKAVHDAGGRIVLQLWHVGRISHESLQPGGGKPVAPSAIRPEGNAFTTDGFKPFPEPRALETDEIPGIVDDYRRAAEHAKRAGFDGVEVHAANGYLLDQFLRDVTNKRTDRYGGSIENRARFTLEAVDAVSEVWGADRVGIRFSPTNAYNDMGEGDSDPVGIFGYVMDELNARGLAYVHFVESMAGPLGGADFEVQEPLVRRLKLPYVANGGFDGDRAAEVIRERRADAVAFGKPYLANPDLVRRLRAGAALNEPDQETFYGGAAEGYVDYPTLDEAKAAA